MRLWDLDQLDAAFQTGLIDESTMLRRRGAPQWRRLGDLLDELEITVQSEVGAGPTSVAPAVVSRVDASVDVAPARRDVLVTTEPRLRARRPRRALVVSIAAVAAAMACAAFVSLLVDGAHATPVRHAKARATNERAIDHVLVVHRDALDATPTKTVGPPAHKRAKRPGAHRVTSAQSPSRSARS